VVVYQHGILFLQERLLNPTNKNVQISPGKVVASAYSISESDICKSKDKSPHENYYDDGKYISTAKELNINLSILCL
jgi:hypothetical protein